MSNIEFMLLSCLKKKFIADLTEYHRAMAFQLFDCYLLKEIQFKL